MLPVIKNILLATDFSGHNNNCVETAVMLCKQHNAVLHLLHVVENRYIIAAPRPGVTALDIMSEIDEDARTRLYNVYESLIREHYISVQIHMPTGIPFDEICKAATEMPIDLIVMGTHGTSGIRAFFMGTTTCSVIKNSTKPVLTIPPNYKPAEFKNIFFPMQAGNDTKERYSFMRLFFKKQATAIHIVALRLTDQEDQLFNDKESCYEIADLGDDNFVTYTKELYTCENFASKVLEISDTANIDLVVIDATPDYAGTQFFIGPYIQQVVNHSKVPVLSFRTCINIADEVKREEEKPFRIKTRVMSGL